VAGRFPLYTDADIRGPVVDALIARGWDVVRAIDTFPEGTDDVVQFEYAVRAGRVLVGNDSHMKAKAEQWLEEGRPFLGLVWWPQGHYRKITAGEFVESFEELAAKDDPFPGVYRIAFIHPKRR
jgi:hypothetical protein